MRGYRFEEEDTGRFALTRDKAGSRLPVIGSVWRFAGSVEIEAESDFARLELNRIKEAILQKGYFLWPDDSGDGA